MAVLGGSYDPPTIAHIQVSKIVFTFKLDSSRNLQYLWRHRRSLDFALRRRQRRQTFENKRLSQAWNVKTNLGRLNRSFHSHQSKTSFVILRLTTSKLQAKSIGRRGTCSKNSKSKIRMTLSSFAWALTCFLVTKLGTKAKDWLLKSVSLWWTDRITSPTNFCFRKIRGSLKRQSKVRQLRFERGSANI